MSSVVMKRSLILALCTASLSAATTAVPDLGIPVNDLYVGLGVAPGPKVTEVASDASGASTGYEWRGNKDTGVQITLTNIRGQAYRWGGFVWGPEAELGMYDITPSSFNVGTVNFTNNTGSTLNYRTLGMNLLGGYECGIRKNDGLRAFVMVLPYVGAGLALAENEVRTGSTSVKDHGYGYYSQYGVRFGAYLTERNWIGGVTLGYVHSSSKVKITIDPYESELRLKRGGVTFGAVAGYRF